jgi:hypothetical protein
LDNELIVNDEKSVNTSITTYDSQLLGFINKLGLPTKNILVPVDERKKIVKNIEDVVNRLEAEKRVETNYISKFIAASAAGLFDAALNYLWDETVFQLRRRIANYDVEYFYDVAVKTDKRKKLSGEKDLNKVDDSELILGAKEIGMISEVGYQHLDYIKYMRNWASAAHPNQTAVTGVQLISWLETCIQEIINLPVKPVTVETGRFLKNIRENVLGNDQISSFNSFIENIPVDKVDNLAMGLFGIYTRNATEQFVRDNITQVFGTIWNYCDDDTKNELGIKYARFSVNGDVESTEYAKELFTLVNGLSYLPDELRLTEIDEAIDLLYQAHENINNFYTESIFASQLKRLVGENKIPTQLKKKYVMTLIYCHNTNGNGVCWDADPIYKELISKFNQEQINIAVYSIMDERIARRLQFNICHNKHIEMLDILYKKNTSPLVGEVIETIKAYGASLETYRSDTAVKQKMKSLESLL